MATKQYKGRKRLKQPDEFVTFSSKMLDLAVEYKTRLIVAASVIVAVALVIVISNYFSKKAASRSLELLNQAVAEYKTTEAQGDAVKAYNTVKDQLAQISKTYGNKAGGKLANFFLADCSFAAGKYKQAAAQYKKAVKDFKGISPFEDLARSSLGYSLAQLGDHKAAASIFSKIPTGVDSYMGDEFLFALSRQYGDMGKTGKQMDAARELLEKYPQSMYVTVVKEKFPNLAEAKD